MNGYRSDRHPPDELYSNHDESSYRCFQMSNDPHYWSQNQHQCSSPFVDKKIHVLVPISSSMTILNEPERNLKSSSTDYYDQIHQQVRLRTSQRSNSTEHRWIGKPSVRASVQTAPVTSVAFENRNERNFSPAQISLGNLNRVVSSASSYQSNQGDDPPLDHPNYTIDSLIDLLVPTRISIPKQTFLHPMLLCSRMHIRPSLFLEKLGQKTFDSFLKVNRKDAIRICHNLFHLLLYWIRTFPYDFRQREMISKFENLFHRLISFESSFQSSFHQISTQLRSKLDAIDRYEEYIKQLNIRIQQNFVMMSNLNDSLTRSALMTDIINECPTPILFAQQLTHIELDRLKPIGAEELIQYFISKSASEKRSKNSNDVHDQKSTICLDTYIQWCNRLMNFVATETLKHTQRRLRSRMINYFIDAADFCYRLNNFNSMSSIIGGLNSQSVRRLKKTWEICQTEKFEYLDQIMSLQKNFSNYRILFDKALKDVRAAQWSNNTIVIPILSIVLRDVYFVKTSSSDLTSAGGINLQKFYSMAKCISEEFFQCKQNQFSVERNEMIINYINTSPTFDEDALLLASFECETPMTSREEQRLKELRAKRSRSRLLQ